MEGMAWSRPDRQSVIVWEPYRVTDATQWGKRGGGEGLKA
jgi:hypothetical protein